MNVPDDHRIQYIAITLIAFAALCIGFGEWRNWIHLVDFAQMFGGGGVGILTGQKMQQLSTKGGGDIINPPSDAPKE